MEADTLVVPDMIVKDFNVYSPFPKNTFLEAKNINKLALLVIHSCLCIYMKMEISSNKVAKSMGKNLRQLKLDLDLPIGRKNATISL